jgi:zinc/manganese transport system substrate-binding protein
MSGHRRTLAALVVVALALVGDGCGSSTPSSASSTAAPAASVSSSGIIVAVGAENEYGNVISQIGGQFVRVTSILSNPNTDPHSFEASPRVAQIISAAQLVVQNGVGYDDFMGKLESASPNSHRLVIDVQSLLKLPDSTANPHLWYSPTTMPAVARALGEDLSALQPTHTAYFEANVQMFISSLNPWLQAIAHFKASYPGTPVATTEPVGDYMLAAAGTDNLTPYGLQADIMNGVDPAPQDIAFEQELFSHHKVKVFVYNQQVTDSLTQSFLAAAKKHGIPVVGVYETMPTPGYDYQSWMLAEVNALTDAIAHHTSTETLQ